MSVTLAPATASPEGSETDPTIMAVVVWAYPLVISPTRTRDNNMRVFIDHLVNVFVEVGGVYILIVCPARR